MNFLEALRERVWISDGAMGTLLQSKGISPGRCLEELNLSLPALVRQVHEEYREAGAEILETNTFGANSVRLAPHGLEERCYEINVAGARLARAVAGDDGVVAGAVGPLGASAGAARQEVFRRQIEALAEGGADLILLETFRDLHELRDAMEAARAACDLPLAVAVSPDEDGNLAGGEGPRSFAPRLAEWGADVIGCNCGVGPQAMLDTLQRMAALTATPLLAQPSAGLPTLVAGRVVYAHSPESLAEVAISFAESGVRWLGGCCGTTPRHIRAIRDALESIRTGATPRLAVAARQFSPGKAP
jgi:homocysteine S-methyltransferase